MCEGCMVHAGRSGGVGGTPGGPCCGRGDSTPQSVAPCMWSYHLAPLARPCSPPPGPCAHHSSREMLGSRTAKGFLLLAGVPHPCQVQSSQLAAVPAKGTAWQQLPASKQASKHRQARTHPTHNRGTVHRNGNSSPMQGKRKHHPVHSFVV